MEFYTLSAFTSLFNVIINNLFGPHENYIKNVNYQLHFYQLGN